MVTRTQGFPDSWQFVGRKTIAYREVGNAFSPPVAKVLGEALQRAFARVRPEPVEDADRQLILIEPAPRARRLRVARGA